MGRAKRSENLRLDDRSPGGGTEEARRDVASLGSEVPDWETSEVCTTPCTTTSVPAAGKLRLASGSDGCWDGSGGVAGLSMTLNGSELSVLLPGVSSGSKETVGKGAGSWLRARGSRGGEEDGVDGDAEEEGEGVTVAVLWRGTELDGETLSVEEPEEEGPTRAVVGRSVALIAGVSSFTLPLWSVVVVFDGEAEEPDMMPGRDGPPSCDSSCSGWSRRVLGGLLDFRRRRSNVQRLWVLEACSVFASSEGML